MLSHAEVVVRAPDHGVALALRGVPDRVRKTACDALEISEDPVRRSSRNLPRADAK